MLPNSDKTVDQANTFGNIKPSNSNSYETIGAPSLLDLSLQTIQRHVTTLYDLGSTPTSLSLRILRFVKRPDQLAIIENNSPNLRAHTGPLWFDMIKNNVFGWQEMLYKPHEDGYVPTEAEVKLKCSFKVYERCQNKATKATERHLKQLQESLEASSKTKKSTIFLNQPPIAVKRRNLPSSSSSSSDLRFNYGSKTKTDTAKGFMTKIRREAADSYLRKPGSSLSTPTHLLKGSIGPRINAPRRQQFKGIPLTERPENISIRNNHKSSISSTSLQVDPIIDNVQKIKSVSSSSSASTSLPPSSKPGTSPKPVKRKPVATVLIPVKRNKR